MNGLEYDEKRPSGYWPGGSLVYDLAAGVDLARGADDAILVMGAFFDGKFRVLFVKRYEHVWIDSGEVVADICSAILKWGVRPYNVAVVKSAESKVEFPISDVSVIDEDELLRWVRCSSDALIEHRIHLPSSDSVGDIGDREVRGIALSYGVSQRSTVQKWLRAIDRKGEEGGVMKQVALDQRKARFIEEARLSNWSPVCRVSRIVRGLEGYVQVYADFDLVADLWVLKFSGRIRPMASAPWSGCEAVSFELSEMDLYADIRPGRDVGMETDALLSRWFGRCERKVLAQWDREAKTKREAAAAEEAS